MSSLLIREGNEVKPFPKSSLLAGRTHILSTQSKLPVIRVVLIMKRSRWNSLWYICGLNKAVIMNFETEDLGWKSRHC